MVAIVLAGLTAAAQHGTAVADADDVAKAQKALFETPYLSEVAVPNSLTYAFRRVANGTTALEDEIVMQLIEDQGDGRRKVAFEFLNGRERMPFAPKEGIRGNPLVMLFLQRDVIHMARAFAGNFNYFRIRILDALRHKVTSERVTRDFQGVPTEMTLLAIEPYWGIESGQSSRLRSSSATSSSFRRRCRGACSRSAA